MSTCEQEPDEHGGLQNKQQIIEQETLQQNESTGPSSAASSDLASQKFLPQLQAHDQALSQQQAATGPPTASTSAGPPTSSTRSNGPPTSSTMSNRPAELQRQNSGDAVSAEREAISMLRDLLVAHIGKRSAGDIFSVLADPTTPFRLRNAHMHRYNEMLEAFDLISRDDALLCPEVQSAEESVANPGFLPKAAVAAIYARAAYGGLMRLGGGDRVTAFMSGAAKSACGKWSASDNLNAFMELADVKPEDVLFSSWTEQTFEPAFVIFWDHTLQWLVITVRGSSEWKSVLTDIAADTCQIADGCAHKGMLRSARWVLKQVRDLITAAMDLHPEYQLVCTGHSLGADVACLLALLLREGDEGEVDAMGADAMGADDNTVAESGDALPSLDSFLEGRGAHKEDSIGSAGFNQNADAGGTPEGVELGIAANVLTAPEELSIAASGSNQEHLSEPSCIKATISAVAYGFGASPLLSPLLAQRCAAFILSFARNADFVTRLSVLSMDRLILELTENSAPKLIKNWFASKFGYAETEKARARAFGNDDLVQYEVLSPPGTLVHINSRVGTRTDLHWALPGMYNELSIGYTMFLDHLPSLYVEDLLHAVREGYHWQADNLVLAGRSKSPGAEKRVLQALKSLIVEQSKHPEYIARLVTGLHGDALQRVVSNQSTASTTRT